MTAQLTFDDEFNSLSLWNGSSGTWDTTFGYDDNNKGSTLTGNSEQEMYINANYAATSAVKPWTVNNGVLTLQAAKASPEISSQINGYQYTSGMINTNHTFAQEYGYFEMKAQLPAGQGLWPAFWLMPTDGSWPPELDIMEVLGND
ncbi:MAG TPA: glycoside hydrolase family 16 protein, partial [Phenylobacterium sp.]|uniref:glycoside hydrolase family 16 protein n=1 Tax=Phenylobacterium sp. TaxID=1871053 RepID=UPI002B49681D